MYRYPTFTLANLMVVITTVGLVCAVCIYLPLFLRTRPGGDGHRLLMMPGALMSGVMMPIVGNLYDRIGPRLLAVSGVVALAYMTHVPATT